MGVMSILVEDFLALTLPLCLPPPPSSPVFTSAMEESIKVKAEKKALIVLIKADDNSTYKNLVDILDEMSICNIGRYAIVDITPSEIEMIKNVVVQ